MIELVSHKCPECGASVERLAPRCSYCGVWFKPGRVDATGDDEYPKRAPQYRPITGFEKKLLLAGGLGIGAVYAGGWAVEDTRYWLDGAAVAVWGAALPVLLAILGFTWRAGRWGLIIGFLVAAGILFAHLAIMWGVRGRVNDDMVGIAVGFAAAALSGWLLGRLVRHYVDKRRA